MHPISELGRNMLAFQERLAKEHGYKPIDQMDLFLGDIRETYRMRLPEWCKTQGDSEQALYSLDGTLLCRGYMRIVIGDYGAFVEITDTQIIKSNLMPKPGQEYRYQDPRYSQNVKYLWLTAKDRSDCKIYQQLKPVSYADYIPGRYYISPYEVALTA